MRNERRLRYPHRLCPPFGRSIAVLRTPSRGRQGLGTFRWPLHQQNLRLGPAVQDRDFVSSPRRGEERVTRAAHLCFCPGERKQFEQLSVAKCWKLQMRGMGCSSLPRRSATNYSTGMFRFSTSSSASSRSAAVLTSSGSALSGLILGACGCHDLRCCPICS